jgi:hypothetical protein
VDVLEYSEDKYHILRQHLCLSFHQGVQYLSRIP